MHLVFIIERFNLQYVQKSAVGVFSFECLHIVFFSLTATFGP